jgi:hypothetical protein
MAANNVALNNPAGRLYSALSRIKAAGGATIQHAFATALEIPQDDMTRIHLNVGLLGLAVDEVSEQLRRINASETLEIYLESVPRLRTALSLHQFGTNWDNYKNLIRDEDLKTLRFCSKELSKVSLEVELSDEQLKQLKTQVDTLYEEVLTSNELEPGLRRVVLEHLKSILEALHEYRIRGLRPVAEALTITAVTLSAASKKRKRKKARLVASDGVDKTKPQTKPLFDRLIEGVKNGMVIINLGKIVYPWAISAKDHWPQIVEGLSNIGRSLP